MMRRNEYRMNALPVQRLPRLLALCILASLAPRAAAAWPDEVWFQEVGATAGLDFVHHSGPAGRGKSLSKELRFCSTK